MAFFARNLYGRLMKIIYSLDTCPQVERAILTIGNYDGVHLGHQHILKRVTTLAKNTDARSVVLTFSNHPSAVLRPDIPHTPLCSLEDKVFHFEQLGIDIALLLPFTEDFANQSPETFLKSVLAHLPFTHLILGPNARFGKKRSGDPEHVKALAKKLNFTVEYLPPLHPRRRNRLQQHHPCSPRSRPHRKSPPIPRPLLI